MGKIIIDNITGLTDLECLNFVKRVIEDGRMCNDNKQYCYLTLFEGKGNTIYVSTDLNKCSDRFVVTQKFYKE